MANSDRHAKLLSLLENGGYIDVKTLVDQLSISEATVRRDLEYLAKKGLIVRTHGGAFFTTNQSTTLDPSIDQKRRLFVSEKRMIGKAAADLVAPGETVILDSGSTTWHVGDQLQSKNPLTVVSNDLQILTHLANFKNFTVLDTGGIIRPRLNILLGPTTVNTLLNLHVNWVFLGVDAVDINRGVSTVNLEEVAVKQAMMQAGKRVVVVADHRKFGKTAFAHVCHLKDVFMVITDAGLSVDQIKEANALGVNVKIVDTEVNNVLIHDDGRSD